MKRIFLLLFSAFFFIVPFSPAEPGDPFAPGAYKPDQQIGILVEWIQLDHRAANKLIRQQTGKASAAEFRNEIETLIDSGDAELVETARITTRDGQRAKVESIDEVVYPTQFELSPTPISPDAKKPDPASDKIPITPVTPDAFDTRNVGTTVEVDPVIASDDKTIDLNLAPEIVYYLGDRHFTDASSGKIAAITQPAFYTIRTSTALTITDGDTVFAAVLTPPKKLAEGKRILVFVKAEILR